MTQKELWKISIPGCVIEDCDEWKIVAAVYGYDGNCSDDADGLVKRTSLIASAPDLLEALKEITCVIECDPRLLDLIGRDRYKKSLAAIAKAEGQR